MNPNERKPKFPPPPELSEVVKEFSKSFHDQQECLFILGKIGGLTNCQRRTNLELGIRNYLGSWPVEVQGIVPELTATIKKLQIQLEVTKQANSKLEVTNDGLCRDLERMRQCRLEQTEEFIDRHNEISRQRWKTVGWWCSIGLLLAIIGYIKETIWH
jgi:hypothetical protein